MPASPTRCDTRATVATEHALLRWAPMSRRAGLILTLVGAISAGAVPDPASAQRTTDDAAASALFDEAVALRNAGDRAGACARFRRSFKLSPARGTLLNIAECFEAEDRLASAWATYRTLADEAEANNDRERLAIARAKHAELAPRLAHVTLVIATPPPGLEVRRGDTTLPTDLLGAPVPTDAGSHTITVSAPGHHPWTARLEVTNGSTSRLDVATLEPLPPPLPLHTVTTTAAAARRRHPRARTGLALVGAGAASAAVGLGFGAAAWSAERDADPTCDPDLVCDQYGYGRLQDARTHAGRADLLIGIGGLLAVTGAVLWWTAPDGAEIQIAPVAGAATLGIAVGGRL